MTPSARLTALFIAIVAIAALLAQGTVTSRLPHIAQLTEVIWVMAAFFTVLVNLAVAISFARVAWSGRMGTAGWNGGLLLWIGTVGLIYHTVLAGIWAPQGLAWWADQGLHTAAPLLTLIWWLAFAPKSPLNLWHPWRWAAVPLLYCAYALVRGQLTGIYAYPFIDVTAVGATRAAMNIAGLTLGFVLGGYAVVFFARRITS